jgi:glucose/arabinose dehydrogenase
MPCSAPCPPGGRGRRAARGWNAARTAALALLCVSTAALTARGEHSFDPMSQVGPNPVLPAPQQYLFPPMHLARVVGWKEGETPTVAPGLKIEPLAQGLEHPRSIYVLPNGDILVVESKSPDVQPIQRPKDIVMGLVEAWVSSGGSTGKSNRITLLRDTNGDGKPQTRSVFLDHLASPFGVALVGNDLYVANTDAIVRYPYTEGDTKITAPGTRLTALPGGPIDHHWTKAWWRVETARCSMSASARTATSPRTDWRRKKTVPRSGKWTARRGAGASSRAACATRTA